MGMIHSIELLIEKLKIIIRFEIILSQIIKKNIIVLKREIIDPNEEIIFQHKYESG
jgi:hypothetical protein